MLTVFARYRVGFLAGLRSVYREALMVDLFAMMQPITFCNLLLIAAASEPAERCNGPALSNCFCCSCLIKFPNKRS